MTPPVDPYLSFVGYSFTHCVVRVYRERRDETLLCCPLNAPMVRNGVAGHPDPTVRPTNLSPFPGDFAIYPTPELVETPEMTFHALSRAYQTAVLAPFRFLGIPVTINE